MNLTFALVCNIFAQKINGLYEKFNGGGNYIPELGCLKQEVEKRYGRKVSTTKDFESLSVLVEYLTNENISSSTLKRMWGYVTSRPVPRVATLNVLSRFIGFKDFNEFCVHLKNSKEEGNFFFTSKVVGADSLEEGARVVVGWNPSAMVILEYLGCNRFKVMECYNCKLLPGDEFEVAGFILGSPLYITSVCRGEKVLPSFVAGSVNGLNLVEVE